MSKQGPTYSVPDADKFESNVANCPHCGAERIFSREEGLEEKDCEKCRGKIFIPAKIGRFWLYEVLGQGGMGCVYRALNTLGGGECAVKVVRSRKKAESNLVENLLREGRAGKALGKHPHIVPVVDFGHDGNEYYLATELIEGHGLDEMIKNQGRIGEVEALDLLLQILDGEKHICSHGYLYRDIKPENIIVNSAGKARILDYGLCLPIEEVSGGQHHTDELEGSPFYLPPERIVGASEGEYSEIYSMGMLMYYMLSGRTYYSEAEIREIVTKHVKSIRISSVGSRLKNCESKTVDIIDKMIARNPNSRYMDLQSLEKDLSELYAELTGPEAIEKAKRNRKKAMLRKWLNLSVGVAALVLLLCGVLFSIKVVSGLKGKRVHDRIFNELAVSKGISPDIRMPEHTPEQLEERVRDRAALLLEKSFRDIPPLDEEKCRMEICRKFRIPVNYPAIPPLTIPEVEGKIEDEIKRKTKREYEKKLNSGAEPDLFLRKHIRTSILEDFDKSAVYSKYGYMKYDGAYCPQSRVVSTLLRQEKIKYYENRRRTMSETRRRVTEETREKIFTKNGYIKIGGEWIPAKEHLERLVFEEMRRRGHGVDNPK